MKRYQFNLFLRKKVKQKITASVWKFAEKTIHLTSENDYFCQKWWKKIKIVFLIKKQLFLCRNFAKALILFAFLYKNASTKINFFLPKFFYWYLTSELLNIWENISNHVLNKTKFTNKHKNQTFVPNQKNWINRLPKMDFDEISQKNIEKITNSGIFLGNVFQLFFLELENSQVSSKDLEKSYELGFYLGVYISICHLQKQNFFSFKRRMKNPTFSLTKMFVNLQYIKILKIFLPKKYNFFIMNFNFFNN